MSTKKIQLTAGNLCVVQVVQEVVRQVYESKGLTGHLRWLHIKEFGRGLFGPLSNRHKEVDGETGSNDELAERLTGQIYIDEEEGKKRIGAKIVCKGWEWTVNAHYERNDLVVIVTAGEGCDNTPLSELIATDSQKNVIKKPHVLDWEIVALDLPTVVIHALRRRRYKTVRDLVNPLDRQEPVPGILLIGFGARLWLIRRFLYDHGLFLHGEDGRYIDAAIRYRAGERDQYPILPPKKYCKGWGISPEEWREWSAR